MSRRQLWAGRVLALVGIVFVAFNIRTSVASLSPLIVIMREEVDISSFALAALGTIPPLCYAAFGVLTPRATRRWGVEVTLLGALILLSVGLLFRPWINSSVELLMWSVVIFSGMGTGNVLLPPLVKKYFPDRIGLLTTVYAVMMSVGSLLPPLVAVPLAEATTWRISLLLWAFLALASAFPWIALLRRSNSRNEPENLVSTLRLRPWRSPMAWAILGFFVSSGFPAYSLFAWMPTFLHEHAGLSTIAAGALLSAFAIAGLPANFVVPVLVARYNLVTVLGICAFVSFVAGYAGLLFAPSFAPLLWVILVGIGTLTFPLSLVLINLRTHSAESAIAVSGFVQGIGYAFVALGTFLFGLTYALSDGWTTSLWLLMAGSLMVIPAVWVARRRRFIEDGA